MPALSRALLGPFWPALARAEWLAVLPDAALCAIPFGALPVRRPRAPGLHGAWR